MNNTSLPYVNWAGKTALERTGHSVLHCMFSKEFEHRERFIIL